jgi:hypothetical protein
MPEVETARRVAKAGSELRKQGRKAVAKAAPEKAAVAAVREAAAGLRVRLSGKDRRVEKPNDSPASQPRGGLPLRQAARAKAPPVAQRIKAVELVVARAAAVARVVPGSKWIADCEIRISELRKTTRCIRLRIRNPKSQIHHAPLAFKE